MTPRVEQLIAEIESLGEVFEWYAPATDASIAALEQALGVPLPPSYRALRRGQDSSVRRDLRHLG